MSNKTRKHIWPVSLVMSIAITGALAAFLVLASNPGDTQAHGAGDHANQGWPACADMTDAQRAIHNGIHANVGSHGTMEPCPTGTGTGTGTMPATGDDIDSSSTSASAGVKLTLTIEDPGMLVAGSSIELYLEDDFNVPNDIDDADVYFVGRGVGRVYVTDPIEIDEDDHYGGDDDTAIQVYVPDRLPDNDDGFDAWSASQAMNIQLVFSKGAGIKNPSEAGTHSVGYSILGPNDDANDGPEVELGTVATNAKVSLSDEDNKRGYELMIVGTGLNDGTTADAYVLAVPMPATLSMADREKIAMWWDGLDCEEMNDVVSPADDEPQVGSDDDMSTTNKSPYCAMYDGLSAAAKPVVHRAYYNGPSSPFSCAYVQMAGSDLGGGTVNTDDTITIMTEVTSPTFRPGNVNHICVIDGEGRASSDVDKFHLEPSIRVVPSTVNAGDTVNVFAQDYPVRGTAFGGILLANESVTVASSSSIGHDNNATASFEVPGGFKGTLRVDATWGGIKKNTKITIAPSELNLSKDDVVANESITIRGSGFGTGRTADCLISATISGAELLLISEDGVGGDDTTNDRKCIDVEVSSGGQFAATVAVWSDDGDNPALTPGTHTIEVRDNQEFVGTATITIKEPTLMVTPGVAGPRDYITISGENWPVENDDGGRIGEVEIEIDFGEDTDDEDADPDVGGRWSTEYRVDGDVIIPSTVRIKAVYGDGSEIVKVSSFSVPQANLTVTPDRAAPGDKITLTATGFTQFESEISVKIGNVRVNVPDGTVTDRDGAIGGLEVIVPSLDAGLYTVQMNVGDPSTVTIGEVTVVEDSAVGVASELPGALSEVGDNLVAAFYWNDATKEWAFFDPRPEFAELNSLTELASGQAYWILVAENQDNVVLNGKSRSLTCAAGSCWNLEVW